MGCRFSRTEHTVIDGEYYDTVRRLDLEDLLSDEFDIPASQCSGKVYLHIEIDDESFDQDVWTCELSTVSEGVLSTERIIAKTRFAVVIEYLP